jgi:hypothetical protein
LTALLRLRNKDAPACSRRTPGSPAHHGYSSRRADAEHASSKYHAVSAIISLISFTSASTPWRRGCRFQLTTDAALRMPITAAVFFLFIFRQNLSDATLDTISVVRRQHDAGHRLKATPRATRGDMVSRLLYMLAR